MYDNLTDVLSFFTFAVVSGFTLALFLGFVSWVVWYLIQLFKNTTEI